MSDKIEPALSPEAWAAHDPGAFAQSLSLALPLFDSEGDLTSHALAARALYGQPFGFTREMAEAINALAWTYAGDPLEGMTPEQRKAEMERIRELAKAAADRILALLPPEGK